MKTLSKIIAVCAIGLAIAAPFSMPASAKTKTVAKPIVFKCIHCGNKISLKSKAGLTKICTACKCGLPMKSCMPPAK